MPSIRSTTFKRHALLVLSIILLGEIITSCSCYAEKKLLYIAIMSLSKRQPSSYFKCTSANMRSLYNIHLVSFVEYIWRAYLSTY
jgi:hypothetical protein